jgi:hypothetical protein
VMKLHDVLTKPGVKIAFHRIRQDNRGIRTTQFLDYISESAEFAYRIGATPTQIQM